MTGHDVHIVGSVPMIDARAAMQALAAALGPRLKRIPDGETGERHDWITWLERVFGENRALEPSGMRFQVHPGQTPRTRYRLKSGKTINDLGFGNLYYAEFAEQSYAVFCELRAEGKIAPGTRFQVDLVPAHSVLWLFLAEELHMPADPIYNDALKGEIDKIVAAIPGEDLAIQSDVASAVFARLERGEPSPYGATRDEMRETFSGIIAGLGNHLPVGAELLIHFCYGDANHRHVVEPTDMGDMVGMANLLAQKITRPIQMLHMPVPRDRDDDPYFAPLGDLRLQNETALCLGLVHYTDGIEGTARRMATARKHAENFMIATECGFGRRPPDTIPELLRIHAEAAELE